MCVCTNKDISMFIILSIIRLFPTCKIFVTLGNVKKKPSDYSDNNIVLYIDNEETNSNFIQMAERPIQFVKDPRTGLI